MPTLVGVVLRVVRVVVDVTGVDKPFDYLVPDELIDEVVVGCRVRVPLHRRTVSGWVTKLMSPEEVDIGTERLLPIAKVVSRGPSAEVVALVEWAAVRWAARARAFFVAASPERIVAHLPSPRHTKQGELVVAPELLSLTKQGGGLVRVGPASTAMDVVAAAMSMGPTIVIAPTLSRARRIAAECRRLGRSTALYPNDWAAAAAGVDVVVGARSSVWASVPGLSAVVVLDEHDDTLQEERVPTWHARDVAIERATRLGVPCFLVSPVPTITARHWAGDRVIDSVEARAWPTVQVIDRNLDERWASSLVTSSLIELLRDHSKRVVCVLNVKGRARSVACDSCRTVARCEACNAGMSQPDHGILRCPRCGDERPVVCLQCGSQRIRSIRVGISRLRDELELAAGRAVQEVKPSTDALDTNVGVFVGTEAVLHRIDRADAVVFLDIDAELLASRYRASEQALDVIAHGARLVAPTATSPGGVLVLQTCIADHEVLRGLVLGDLSQYEVAESGRRNRLRLPPFGALAEISGTGTQEAVQHLRQSLLVEVAEADGRALVRSSTWESLSEALRDVPKGKLRARIAVDPARV